MTPAPRPAFHLRLLRSFYYAFAGLFHLFKSQRNARIELIIGIVACALAGWLLLKERFGAVRAFGHRRARRAGTQRW